VTEDEFWGRPKDDRTFNMPVTYCPHCGHRHDAATNLEAPRAPGKGDVSICLECGGVALFDMDPVRLRMPTPAEQVELESNQAVVSAQLVIAAMAMEKKEA
jgi:hypothetical protein